MLRKAVPIFAYLVPIVLMIGLIPVIADDYLLTAVYLICIVVLLLLKRGKHDLLALVVGILCITASEYLFISTGVETFLRDSLFGIMPLWLPFLWGYVFVTVVRVLKILDR